MIVDNLLSRLDKVKKTGSSQWVACCPAHGSEGRKLAISEGDDGRILLKCWSRNCHPTEIVDSVGLTMPDLFPEHLRYKNQKPLPPSQRWIPRTVLAALYQEILVVQICADTILKMGSLTPNAIKRLTVASQRILNVVEEVTYD
jgi:hypothetical protein